MWCNSHQAPMCSLPSTLLISVKSQASLLTSGLSIASHRKGSQIAWVVHCIPPENEEGRTQWGKDETGEEVGCGAYCRR